MQFDQSVADAQVSAQDFQRLARIFQGNTQQPFSVQVLTAVPLTTAMLPTAPYKITTAFRTVWVRDATDSSVTVNLRLFSQDNSVGSIPLRQNDAITFPYPVSGAYLDWSAQSGKTITLVFMTDGEVQLGTRNSAITGGVNIQDGTAASAIVSVSLTASTATIIAPANSNRKLSTIVNLSGGTLYVGGDNTVTDNSTIATQGIPVLPQGILEWRNTAALWGFTTSSGTVNRLDET